MSGLLLIATYLKIQGERKSNSNEIIAVLREDVTKMTGFKEIAIKPLEDSPVKGQPVEIEVIGNNDLRYQLADKLLSFLENHDSVLDCVFAPKL